MNASLRLRLALLVVCSVALAVALVLYLTWQRVGETMIGMEEKNFATLLLVEEERLNTATLNHLAAKVRSVLLRKAQLRDTSARVQALLRALAPQHPAGSGQAHLVLQPLSGAGGLPGRRPGRHREGHDPSRRGHREHLRHG